MRGVGFLAGWVAMCTYDGQCKVPLEHFVKAKIKTALLQRYRSEWKFASRCCHCAQTESENDDEAIEMTVEEIADLSFEAKFWWRVEVRNLLARLEPKEHYLLERLFIDGVTEQEVAEELGISQPTVNRWKRKVLQKLRDMLSGQT